ncbi:hypothetical protein FBQ96_03525 [Nitrospirales bacterium NOB]|nr:hypothetical protein [Nitrospirales bacterium NOB]
MRPAYVRPTHLIITVHGIRTFGQWQERLAKLIRSAEPTARVCNYHYGYFSIIAFMIPFLRWIVTRRFRHALIAEASNANWDRIDIVAHSFGTHLVAWAIHEMNVDTRPRIHTVILAGSVLKPWFPWSDLIGKGVYRLVNDCGTKDGILILNQLFVLFSGMAGRIGFNGMTNEQFRNRFFAFGHSGYFVKKYTLDDSFMKESWIPLLCGTASA